MSFWGKLAQIGLAAAAPFTGGATAALIPAIGMGVGAVDSALSKNPITAGVDANGNPVNAPTNSAYANQAQALINNRFRQTPLDQAGVNADTQAMRNMFRAGLVSRMNPNAAPLPGLRQSNGTIITNPNLAPTTVGQQFAELLQTKLGDRLKNGQALTVNGVPAPSQEETDANKKALDAAGIGTGLNSKLTSIGNLVNSGASIANFGKRFYDLFQKLGGTKPAAAPNAAAPTPGVPYYNPEDYSAPSDMFGSE